MVELRTLPMGMAEDAQRRRIDAAFAYPASTLDPVVMTWLVRDPQPISNRP
jgi:hypothetical protein